MVFLDIILNKKILAFSVYMDSTNPKTNRQVPYFLTVTISKHENASIIIGGDLNSSQDNIDNATAKRIEKFSLSNMLTDSYRFLYESIDTHRGYTYKPRDVNKRRSEESINHHKRLCQRRLE